jgi:hypothetical protein
LRGDRAQKTGVGEFRGVTMGVDGPVGSGRSLRLDPFALPARYAARDGGADGQVRQIDLDRERVILMRAVRGIPMKVRLPVNEFRGVTLRTLFVAPEGDEVQAQWKAWGRVLGVPLLVVEDDGSLREPFRRLGRIGLGAPSPRKKRRAAIRWRRPSILMRRKPGRPSVQPQVHRGEREIIARD